MLNPYLAGGLAVSVALLGFTSWRLDRVKADLSEARAEISSLQAFKEIAVEDAQEQADQCLARVKAARASAQRIETIIERPIHVDPQGCAVRESIPAGELRDALQAPGPDTP